MLLPDTPFLGEAAAAAVLDGGGLRGVDAKEKSETDGVGLRTASAAALSNRCDKTDTA